jgi:hypothetical protein
MDTNDLEDMLFEPHASPENSEDATSGISDDDMLDEADIDEVTLWDEADSPLLLPTYDDVEVNEHVDLTTSSQQHALKVLPTSDSIRPDRDR